MRDLARNAAALLALLPASVAAWATGPANRILARPARPDTAIAQSVPARVKSATDLGQAPLDKLLPSVTLHFSRSAAQQAALSTLLAAQQNPSSPLYRKWLTPAQFGQQFGLSDSDLAQVTGWLTSQGLKVTGTSYTKTSVTISGTVAQVQRAFGVSLREVKVGGEEHISNVTNPVLPAAIASVTRGITGLTDFRPKPRAIVRPKYTSTNGGAHYLVPGDINTIYDLKPLLASAINGTGITIAVMGQTAVSTTDVAAFRSAAGLPANTPTLDYTPVNLPVSSYDLAEAQLDVEWAGAVAPNATIVYVATNQGNGVFTALTNSIQDTPLPAKIITISYGTCEQNLSTADALAFQDIFEQASIQGQTIVGPAGDDGAADCDDGSDTEVAAADGLAVDFPGSSPNVTSVGGTMFNEASGSYWNSTNNSTDQSSALSYIPETAWNETATYGSLAATGGGSSIYFTKPAWQVGNGVPQDGARDVPDLAFSAAALHDGYLICTSGSCVNGFAASDGSVAVIGGTSVSTPIFAGMLALVEQKIGQPNGLGNINPQLYGLANSTAYSSIFHDVTSGTNSVPCLAGSPNCATTGSASNGSFGFSAGTGYDLVTGWGSVDGSNLANFWTSAAPAGQNPTPAGTYPSATTVSLPSGAASCGISTGSLVLTVAVTAGQRSSSSISAGLSSAPSAAPTGTVQLYVDNKPLGSPAPLSSGTATFTLNTVALTSGGHSITASYSGDSAYAGSRGNLSPSISPTFSAANDSGAYVPSFIDVALTNAPDFSITPCLPVLTVTSGGTGSIPFTITGLSGFSGTVTLSTSFDGSFAGATSFSATQVSVSSAAAGTATLNVQAFKQTATTSARLHSGPGSWSGSRGLAATGAGGAALASLLFLTLPRRRRYIGLLVAVVSVGALGTLGCGKGVSTIPSSGGGGTTSVTTVDLQAGYYIINVTASGTSSSGAYLTHTSYLTVHVTE